MAKANDEIYIFLEVGRRRTFAGAVEWPGWCRSGRDEASALRALLEYGPRYERVLHRTSLGFNAPGSESLFSIIERVDGNATTDFGAPDAVLKDDGRPVDETDLYRFQALLEACWAAFDQGVRTATGKELRKGPRGGGRELEGIVRHVLNADAAYLTRLGSNLKLNDALSLDEQVLDSRRAIFHGLTASEQGLLPDVGPRGGVRWKPRTYLRRMVWHLLDHLWEIEDRIQVG